MCQPRLNTSDSCPAGKFGVRVRTGRVKDQVAANKTRRGLSSSLEWAQLTERRKEKRDQIERKGDGERSRRGRVKMTDIEERGGKATKQALLGRKK